LTPVALRNENVKNNNFRFFQRHFIRPILIELQLSASEMTYIVSGGALNSTHSLTSEL